MLTRPPARAGRGRKLHPSPVAEVARERGIPLIETSSVRGEDVQAHIERVGADLGVVVAFGALIPPAVLDIPTYGWINLHFSDLPRWRGAAPVQSAILAGDATTASCIFQLEEGLDTGPVFSRLPVRIGHETSGELLDRMAILGSSQVLDVVTSIEDGSARTVPQEVGADSEFVTRAPRIDPQEGFIDFRDPAVAVDRRIRAVTPNPGAWTLLADGRRLKLGVIEVGEGSTPGEGVVRFERRSVEVGCADTVVVLGRVAPAGRGWMDADAWARGARLNEHTVLGSRTHDDGEAVR